MVVSGRETDMWFGVSLFFEALGSKHERQNNLWEDRVILVHADDEAAAVRRAMEIGSAEETCYQGAEGEIKWTFRFIERVYPLDGFQLADGVEVFSRHLRDSEVQSLRKAFD